MNLVYWAGILAAMQARIDHNTPTERAEADRQVTRIAELRLKEALK